MADLADQDWNEPIARSLAFLCLHAANVGTEKNAQADFLLRLGLPLEAVAEMVGSTEESLRVMQRRKGSGKGQKRGSKATESVKGKARGKSKRG